MSAERRLTWVLRVFAVLCGAGTLVFLVRPEDSVRMLDAPGRLFGLPALPEGRAAVASDFWFPHAIAHMALLTATAWMASEDAQHRRILILLLLVSLAASSLVGLLLFVRWWPAFVFLSTPLFDLPVAVLLIMLRRASRN